MNFLVWGINKLINKKIDKKNELFSIFNEYVKQTHKINSLKNREKILELKKIENQIDEYFIPLSDLVFFIDLNNIQEKELISKIKHISELTPSVFSFSNLYATPHENGILLTSEKTDCSELVRIVTYKKVN